MNYSERSLLDPEVLREIFRRIASTDIDELEVTSGSSRLYLRREPGLSTPTRRPEVTAAPQPQGVPVTAPLTGILYTRPSPDEPPFVIVGGIVEEGQAVALIETMKLFNEVTTEVAGEVLSTPLADGTLVEAGQAILYLLPRAEAEVA